MASDVSELTINYEEDGLVVVKELDKIVKIVRKHIPLHTADAIKASLRSDLEVINYTHLNIDKEGLKLIMDYALEGHILEEGLDIDLFADENFKIEL